MHIIAAESLISLGGGKGGVGPVISAYFAWQLFPHCGTRCTLITLSTCDKTFVSHIDLVMGG